MTDLASGTTSATAASRIRTYTLLILTAVYVFNFIDRQILVILQPLIKAELNLSDTQLGLLTGFAFALFYTVLGLPIARLADRTNRRNIISVALAVWSAMTALSGFAQTYVQLLLARVGVGVGEAGASPPAHSMISDLYEPRKRATALSVYSAGLYLGVMLGFMTGGYFGQLLGWRATFLLVGLPGILLALVLRFTVREPARGQHDGGAAGEQPTIGQTIKLVWRLRSFRYFAFGSAMAAFVSYGTSSFMPSFMVRYHHIPLAEIGFLLGLTAGGGGMIGTYLGGYLTDKLGTHDPRWYLWLPGLSAAFAIPVGVAAFTTENSTTMLILYFFTAILATFYLGPTIAVAHRLVAPRLRAMTSAILFLILNLIGLGLGPLLVGVISDAIKASTGEDGLRTALLVCICVAVTKGLLYWRAGYLLPQDLAAKAQSDQTA